MKWRKWMALLLPVLLLLTGCRKWGAEKYGDLYYKVTTDGEVYISACEESATGKIKIPSEIDGKPVTALGSKAFYCCTKITEVIVSDSVEDLGYHTFDGCKSLTAVVIGDGVENIDNSVFWNCPKLERISIGAGVKTIVGGEDDYWPTEENMYLFSGNDNLTSVEVDEDNTVYSSLDGVLYDKNRTKLIYFPAGRKGSYTMPDTVTVEGDIFWDCRGLTAIEVSPTHSKYSSLDGVLFSKSQRTLIRCPRGKSGAYTIPDTVESVEESAFVNCNALTSVSIPAGVTMNPRTLFRSCEALTAVQVDPQNEEYVADDGVVLNRDKTTLLFCPRGRKVAYTIPDSVTNIDEDAFKGCQSLPSVTISEGVVLIGESAFEDCASLTSITIPDSVTLIGEHAFRCCVKLKKVSIGSGVGEIQSCAFYGCTSLTSATIPDNVTTIGEFLFCGCTSLTSATLGKGVTYIQSYTFKNCAKLESVTFSKNVTKIVWAFEGCTGLTDVYYDGTPDMREKLYLINDDVEILNNATWHYGK